jgi:predicted nucleotidyltransferase
MRLEHYPQEKLKKMILESVGRHLDLKKYKVFFFGSRVEGKGTDRSDIDVGIEGPAPVPFEAWQAIQEEIEDLPTLYKIEIVDFGKVTSKFYEVAKQHIEVIN